MVPPTVAGPFHSNYQGREFLTEMASGKPDLGHPQLRQPQGPPGCVKLKAGAK